MKIFVRVREIFEVVGIKSGQKRSFNLWNSLSLLLYIQFTISPMIFLFTEAGILEEYVNSFYAFITGIGNTSGILVCTWKMKNIFQLMNNMENCIDERSRDPVVKKFYEEVIEKVEKWSKIFYLILVKVTLPGIVMPNFLITLFIYFTTDSGENAFLLPFPASFPFNWRMPFGYAFAFLSQAITFFFVLQYCSGFLCNFYGFCWFSMAFAEDITREWITLCETKRSRLEYKKKIKKFVDFHSKAKQFICEFGGIYGIYIMAYAIWSISTICSTLFMVRAEISQSNSHIMEVIHPMTLLFCSFVHFFSLCNYGERVIAEFNKLGDAIYQSNWYLQPIEIQRSLPIIMISAKRTPIIEGFANVACTHETFKRVNNGGFSYFTILRQIE